MHQGNLEFAVCGKILQTSELLAFFWLRYKMNQVKLVVKLTIFTNERIIGQ